MSLWAAHRKRFGPYYYSGIIEFRSQMYIFLPVVVYLLFVHFLRQSRAGWRDSFLCGAALWGLALFIITEILSLPRQLSLWPLIFAWALLGAGVYLASKRWRSPFADEFPSDQPPPQQGSDPSLLIWPVILIFAFLVLTCLVGAPNTSDAMRYHMPRIVYWFEYKSIAHYATTEYNQLQMPPFAEFAMLHAFILAKGDRFVTFVQLLGFFGSAIAASVIARTLGGSRFVQSLSAFLCVMIPVAILESTGAKNDCFKSLWLMLALYGGMRFGQNSSLFWALISAVSIGLAILTKGTSMIYAPIFFLTGLLSSGFPKTKTLRFIPIFVLFIVGVNLPHWVRNYELSGSPLGFPSAVGDWSRKEFRYPNEDRSVIGIICNVLRNAALHVSTPSGGVNKLIEKQFRLLIQQLGRNPDDPAALWTATTFAINDPDRHEALAPNPHHFGLFVVCLGMLLYLGAWRTHPSWVVYAAGVAIAFIAFSAILRWQPWHTRLHMPFFFAACPLIALVLERCAPKTVKPIVYFLLLMAGPLVLVNALRPLMYAGNIFDQPRADLYFQEHGNLKPGYQQMANNFETGFCNDVGVDSSLNVLEYPMLALLRPGEGRMKVRQMGSTPLTTKFGPVNPTAPCAIICLGCAGNLPKLETYKEHSGRVRVFGESVLLSKVATFGCDASFVSGWYGRDVLPGGSWLYWTEKAGTVKIYSETVRTLLLSGEVNSLVNPNRVEISVNNAVVSHLPVGVFNLKIEIPAGASNVKFQSEQPGTTTRNDSRTLAIGLRNVSFRVAGSRETCTVLF